MAKIKNLTALEGFHNGLAIIAIQKGRSNLMGMINTTGEIVIEPKYHRIHGTLCCPLLPFVNDLGSVEQAAAAARLSEHGP